MNWVLDRAIAFIGLWLFLIFIFQGGWDNLVFGLIGTLGGTYLILTEREANVILNSIPLIETL